MNLANPGEMQPLSQDQSPLHKLLAQVSHLGIALIQHFHSVHNYFIIFTAATLRRRRVYTFRSLLHYWLTETASAAQERSCKTISNRYWNCVWKHLRKSEQRGMRTVVGE